MDHPDKYLCVCGHAEGDYRERGSKFLGFASPCSSEEELKMQVHVLKKQHPSARHVCYGAVLGAEHPEQRSSDAGEPSGTAGLPILNQVLSANLRNTSIIVVRYFGGTKLGKPGLIHAYKESARAALSGAVICERFITQLLQLDFGYPQSGDVMRLIDRMPEIEIVKKDFTEACKITLAVPKSKVPEVLHLFNRLPLVHVTPLD